MDIKKEIENLRLELMAHNSAYYDNDTPTISDFEYDAMMRKLIELETEYPEYKTADSPTQRVGGSASTQFTPVVHEVPLESLNDVFSFEELGDFCRRVDSSLESEHSYIVEPKIDGLSVAIEYVNGKLYRGATRGDGQVGEDVTDNVKTIRSLPHEIKNAPERLIVRGEVYMAKSIFEEINATREISGEKLMANPRNAAAGSMRQLDSKVTAQRKLDIIIFNIQSSSDMSFTSHEDCLNKLTEMGFSTVPYLKCSSLQDCCTAIENYGENRENFAYDIDGAVVKINSLSQRISLGSTAKAPRWAAAYKYPPEQKESKIIEIAVQVGRTGVLTPKAIVEPVRLAGTTVTNATLHNQDFIDKLDVRIGDTVLIQKAGEIIPEVLSVNLSKRPETAVIFRLPETCPACGSPTTRDDDGAAIRCTGAECPAQLLRSIAHFASRNAMDIEGLGISVSEALIEAGLLHSAADIYYLKAEDIEKIDRMGKKSAENLINAIENSKENSLDRLLFAFGIRQVGRKAAKNIVNALGGIDEISSASPEELNAIDDIGPITAEFLRNWLDNPQSQHQIALLREAGVNLKGSDLVRDTRFLGKIFVLTGSLETLSRNEASEIIENMGGKASSSISKKTSYVVAGDKAGSKLKKANDLGIPVLTEAEFIEMTK